MWSKKTYRRKLRPVKDKPVLMKNITTGEWVANIVGEELEYTTDKKKAMVWYDRDQAEYDRDWLDSVVDDCLTLIDK